MVRSNKMKQTFDLRLQKALQQSNARRQRVARERQDRFEEAKEDLEFDRVHARLRSLAGGTKSNDPIAHLSRLATQLSEAPEYAEEIAALEAQQAHQQAFLDAQQVVTNAQAKHHEQVLEAKKALAQRYQSNRW